MVGTTRPRPSFLGQAAICGVGRLGEVVCACTVAAGPEQPSFDETVSDLRAKRLATHKLPQRAEYFTSLPRTGTGKIRPRGTVWPGVAAGQQRWQLYDRRGHSGGRRMDGGVDAIHSVPDRLRPQRL